MWFAYTLRANFPFSICASNADSTHKVLLNFQKRATDQWSAFRFLKAKNPQLENVTIFRSSFDLIYFWVNRPLPIINTFAFCSFRTDSSAHTHAAERLCYYYLTMTSFRSMQKDYCSSFRFGGRPITAKRNFVHENWIYSISLCDGE